MGRYEVRCCCEPEKLLGYVDLPRADYRSGEKTFVLRLVRTAIRRSVDDDKVDPARDRRAEIEFRRYRDPKKGIDQIVVYSDDHPLDFWNQLAGFGAAKHADVA